LFALLQNSKQTKHKRHHENKDKNG